jgi:hypothetical protein
LGQLQLKPELQLDRGAPQEATLLSPPDMPPGTEISFSTSSDWQFGQAGGGAEIEKMIFSYRTPHSLHRYS